MSNQVSEKEARQVAESARETKWEQPSFGKELFLGNFRLDLIHPQPQQDPAAIEKGEAFLSKLRLFLEEHVDPQEIEREAKIPEQVLDGLKDIGSQQVSLDPAKDYRFTLEAVGNVLHGQVYELDGAGHAREVAAVVGSGDRVDVPEGRRLRRNHVYVDAESIGV